MVRPARYRFHSSHAVVRTPVLSSLQDPEPGESVADVVNRPAWLQRSGGQLCVAVLLALKPRTPHVRSPNWLDIRRTLPVAETLHNALIRKAAGGRKIDCPVLTGQDRNGQPLSSGHQHAHVFPLDLDGDRVLDHALIWAPMGLDETALQAIRQLRTLCPRRFSGAKPVSVSISSVRGGLRSMMNLPAGAACLEPSSEETSFTEEVPGQKEPQSCARRTSPESFVWVSVTPFLPSRYIKNSGRNSLHGQVQAELRSRRLPPAAKVDVVATTERESQSFICTRSSAHQPPNGITFSLRLTFDAPVYGPVALGYASHFGMGMFRRVP